MTTPVSTAVSSPASTAASAALAGQSELLKPYVPRLVIDWLRFTPEAIHREVEASLVFVDISGFTALTERLARKGKIGAELMRDTLDGVFTALLDESYDWGAGLLKWGGDALLLMFDGPGHVERSCRAAWEMQRTIDRVGRVHVSSGDPVILRMSVGIGTGLFHFFMTGSVHRELLIAGPSMSETLVMEAIADAGEIGISPAVATLLDPSCIGPTKMAARLLAAPPAVERERAPDVGDVSDLDIASCIPVAARAHVLRQKSEAEHRTITAAFIDMMDTDRLLDELGPQALAEGLDARIRSIQESALRYEVPFYETDVGKSSVKALLTAGAPSSTGHDEERMLRALREVMERPGIVPMRIGVNTGKVFTGDFGPPYRRAYRVFGDAINTAARVMSKAEAGQILSTEIVLNRSRTLFDATPIEPFAAKGKSEPVHASVVGRAIGTREGHHGETPLIGRDAELRTLLDVIDRARARQGSIVEIASEPGLGKTRLVDELVGRAPDFRVLRSMCEEYEGSTPYFPIRAIMRTVLGLDPSADTPEVIDRLTDAVGQLDERLVPWIPLLGILLGLDLPDTPETAALDQRFLRDRLVEVALRFLGGSLADSPTIVVIEDAHHIDEATGDLLVHLSRAAADRRQVLIVTYQGTDPVFPANPEGPPPSSTKLELGPLPLHRVVEIIEIVTDEAPLRPHDVDEIARRSAGNPLFLLELLDAVRETGSVGSLPDSIEALVAGEIDRLAPADRTILRYAAVLGSNVDPDLLIDAVGDAVKLDGDWSRLAGLLDLDPSGVLRFRSTLIRDAAYEGLPYRRRRTLHDRVGMTIEARAGASLEEEIGVLAFHYHEAQRWDKAWRFCREAGDRAMAVYANLDATRFYDKALTAGRRLRGVGSTELAALYELSSDALYRLGEFARGDRALRAARRHVGHDPIKAAPLVVKQAIISTRSAQYRRAVARVSRALHALEGLPGRPAAASRARLMVEVAAVRFLQNRRIESIDWCRRAIREAKRGHERHALAEAYKVLDMALLENGEIKKATYSERALAIYQELEDLRSQVLVLNNLGLIAHDRSRWDRSRELYERALELADIVGDRSMGALVKYNISEILIDQCRYDEAEPLLREVIRVWRASGAEADVAEAQRESARLLSRRRNDGDLESARRLLDAARKEQTVAGKAGEVLLTDSRIAEMLVLAGESEQALEVIERALAEVGTTEGGSVVVPRLQRLRGWGLLQTGRTIEAAASLRRALQSARRRDDVYEAALALDGLIAVGQLAGRPMPDLLRERDALYLKLGITRPLTIPLKSSAPLAAAAS